MCSAIHENLRIRSFYGALSVQGRLSIIIVTLLSLAMSITVQRLLLEETLSSGEFYGEWSMRAIPIMKMPWCARCSYPPSSYVSHTSSRVLQRALRLSNDQKSHLSARSRLSLKPGSTDIHHVSRSRPHSHIQTYTYKLGLYEYYPSAPVTIRGILDHCKDQEQIVLQQKPEKFFYRGSIAWTAG